MASSPQPSPLTCFSGIPNETLSSFVDKQVYTKKIHDLSPKVMEESIHDLHGLADIVEETDEFIRQQFEELELELQKIPNTYSLDLAKSQNLDYVMNLRLMFLRGGLERFNPRACAARMTCFFELKRNLFGEDKLVKDITWRDLPEEDQKALERGGLQLLPLRDRAGRAILFRVGRIFSLESAETQSRLLFFTIMKALEDEEIQKRGIVRVHYNVGQEHFFSGGTSAMVAVFSSVPQWDAGIHFCYDNPKLEKLLIIIQYLISLNEYGNGLFAPRFRPHYGSHMECLYALMTFGIIRDAIPITATGEVDLQYHKIWLKRIQKEPPQRKEGIQEFGIGAKKIIVPGPMDVILGRGTHAKNSAGHLRFKYLLETYREQYDALSQSHRRCISRLLSLELKQSGVRFIKQDGNGEWVEITEKEKISKISHGFRNMRTTVDSSNASRLNKLSQKRRALDDIGGNEKTPKPIAVIS